MPGLFQVKTIPHAVVQLSTAQPLAISRFGTKAVIGVRLYTIVNHCLLDGCRPWLYTCPPLAAGHGHAWRLVCRGACVPLGMCSTWGNCQNTPRSHDTLFLLYFYFTTIHSVKFRQVPVKLSHIGPGVFPFPYIGY